MIADVYFIPREGLGEPYEEPVEFDVLPRNGDRLLADGRSWIVVAVDINLRRGEDVRLRSAEVRVFAREPGTPLVIKVEP